MHYKNRVWVETGENDSRNENDRERTRSGWVASSKARRGEHIPLAIDSPWHCFS